MTSLLFYTYMRLLKAPSFRGKSRLEGYLRKGLAPAQVRVDRDIKMELDPCEWTQVEMLISGTIEPLSSCLMRSILRSGDTFVDVGAHVGFHSLVAARAVGPRGKVIAIEPQPYNCERILRNSHINGITNLAVYVAAAGERDGFVVLHQQVPLSKAKLTLVGSSDTDCPQQFIVPMRRLDGIVREIGPGRIALLKIDVEEFELQVLRGLGDAMSVVDNIVLEVLAVDSALAAAIASLLTAKGFFLKTVAGTPWRPGQPCPENNILATRNAGAAA